MAERTDNTIGIENSLPSGLDTLVRRYPYWSKLGHQPLEIDLLQRHIDSRKISIQDAAPRFRELLEQNPAWSAIFEEFGGSPKHFARLMVTLFADRFFAYSDIYKVALRLNIGDSRKNTPRVFRSQFVELPEFSDKANQAHDILVDYAISSRLRDFSKNQEQVLLELSTLVQSEDNQVKKAAYQEALEFLTRIKDLRIPAFKSKVHLRPHQARAALKGLHHGVPEKTKIGLFHDTRTGKTLTTLARFESLGAGKILVVVPASLKTLWRDEINRVYEEPPGTVILESGNTEQDLEKAMNPETKFVIVSYDFLVRRNKMKKIGNKRSKDLISSLEKIGFDGMVADESHLAANWSTRTQRSKVIKTLATMKSIKHLILATATPVDRVEDISFTAHLLDPTTYPTPSSFSEQLRNNPRLSHNELLALVDRVKAEEVMDLPEVQEKRRLVLDLTPTQQALYDFVLNQEDLPPLSKLNALRAICTHQRLLKGLNIKFDENEQMRWLTTAYMDWQKLSAKNPEIKFDSDFLASNKHYFYNVYLPCLLNLKGSVTELVSRYFLPSMIDSWKGESIPSKFLEIERQIRDRISKGEKIIIATGYRTEGVTQGFRDHDLNQEALDTLLQYLQKVFGSDRILKIDGEDSTNNDFQVEGEETSRREFIRKQWKTDRSKDILLISAGAAGQGMDLAIEDSTVSGVTMVIESLPFSYRKFIQLIGRLMSDKQASPVSFLFLESNDTVEQEIFNLIEQKGIPIEMLLDAVALTEEEEEILSSTPENIKGALARMVRSHRQNISWMFRSIVGKSSQDIKQFFSDEFRKGETNEEYMAKHFDELMEGYPGNTSQLVKIITEKLIQKGEVSPDKIADFGSGPLVLARALGFPVISLDISPLIMKEGVRKLQEQGISVPEESIKIGDLTDIPDSVIQNDSLDLGVCSLALDCTEAGQERIKAIINMASKIKDGKHLILTIPSASLTADQFKNFMEAFKDLGLIDTLSLSGYVKGVNSGSTIFNGWLFVLTKTAEPGVTQPEKLVFSFDKEAVSNGNKKTETMLQRLVRERAARASKPEEFSICVPIEGQRSDLWPERGTISELLDDTLLKHLLNLSDSELSSLGYRRQLTFQQGQEKIQLVRL